MKDCRSEKPCKYCNIHRSHHYSLCNKKYGPTEKPSGFNVETKSSSLNVDAKEYNPVGLLLSASTNQRSIPTTNRGISVLGTAFAVVIGEKCSQRLRIVMDNGSTRSFARIDLLKHLGAKKLGSEKLGLAGLESKRRHYDQFGCFKLYVASKDSDEIRILVNGLKSITCPVDRYPLNSADYPILKQFDLSDQIAEFENDVQLDVLVGLDYYYQFVGSIEVRLDSRLVLLGSKLGYIVNGSTTRTDPALFQRQSTTLLAISGASPDSELDYNLERLWKLEDVAFTDQKQSADDEIAAEKFRNTMRFDEESKRYSVRWPWKEGITVIPDNYGLANGRLKGLLKRTNHEILQTCDKTIQDQLTKSIIEVVLIENPTASSSAAATVNANRIRYIPHHCVVRPDKTTTKVRVVYDASAKSKKDNLSLNECLYRGPVLLGDLCGLIIRFRQEPIGITSDIEEVLLQVGLEPVDRDVTRFLWVKDILMAPTKSNLITYRFARVPFGVISSPYMLAGTIEHHLSKLNTPVTQKILHSCYVDNVINSCENTSKAMEYYTEAKAVFKSASMNLQWLYSFSTVFLEWFSNDKEFMHYIAEKDRGSGPVTTVLGLQWNTIDDSFSCQSKLTSGTKCTTKRQMLKAIAQFFDPCSFLAPVMVAGKLILQQVWKSKVDWDSIAPNEILEKWNQFFDQMVSCTSIRIPRLITTCQNGIISLHCFCDASQSTYAEAVYQVVTNSRLQDVDSALVFANVRVSPIKEKQMSIPRLELTALLMGCRLFNFVKKEHDIAVTDTYG